MANNPPSAPEWFSSSDLSVILKEDELAARRAAAAVTLELGELNAQCLVTTRLIKEASLKDHIVQDGTKENSASYQATRLLELRSTNWSSSSSPYATVRHSRLRLPRKSTLREYLNSLSPEEAENVNSNPKSNWSLLSLLPFGLSKRQIEANSLVYIHHQSSAPPPTTLELTPGWTTRPNSIVDSLERLLMPDSPRCLVCNRQFLCCVKLR